jgi:hypothetical protein
MIATLAATRSCLLVHRLTLLNVLKSSFSAKGPKARSTRSIFFALCPAWCWPRQDRRSWVQRARYNRYSGQDTTGRTTGRHLAYTRFLRNNGLAFECLPLPLQHLHRRLSRECSRLKRKHLPGLLLLTRVRCLDAWDLIRSCARRCRSYWIHRQRRRSALILQVWWCFVPIASTPGLIWNTGNARFFVTRVRCLDA